MLTNLIKSQLYYDPGFSQEEEEKYFGKINFNNNVKEFTYFEIDKWVEFLKNKAKELKKLSDTDLIKFMSFEDYGTIETIRICVNNILDNNYSELETKEEINQLEKELLKKIKLFINEIEIAVGSYENYRLSSILILIIKLIAKKNYVGIGALDLNGLTNYFVEIGKKHFQHFHHKEKKEIKNELLNLLSNLKEKEFLLNGSLNHTIVNLSYQIANSMISPTENNLKLLYGLILLQRMGEEDNNKLKNILES